MEIDKSKTICKFMSMVWQKFKLVPPEPIILVTEVERIVMKAERKYE